MDSIKEDIHQELRRLRLDKKHLYSTLLKIIDALPQEKSEAVEEAPAPVEVEEKSEEAPAPVEVVEEVPPVKKSGGRKKKTLTVKA